VFVFSLHHFLETLRFSPRTLVSAEVLDKKIFWKLLGRAAVLGSAHSTHPRKMDDDNNGDNK